MIVLVVFPGRPRAFLFSDVARFPRKLVYFFVALYFISLQINMSVNLMDKPKNRIREVLEEKGIKQTWLAEKLGKSFCIVNSYVCNRRQPSLEVLFEIANILQVDPKELIKSEQI